MTTNQKPVRPDYQQTLKSRAAELYGQLCELGDGDKSIELIYQCLKQTALESWKNGIDAGRRKARPTQAKAGKSA